MLREKRPELSRVEIGCGRVAFVEAGAGQPVVFAHDFGDHLVTWRHQIKALSAEARVIALDLPGYGDSDKPRLEYTPAFFVDSLREFIAALELEAVSLVGAGLGAAASLGLALRDPGRVKTLAMICPCAPGAVPTGKVLDVVFRLVRWPAVARSVVSVAPRVAVRMHLRQVVSDAGCVDGVLVGHYHSRLRRPGAVHAYVSTAAHWREWVRFRPRMDEVEQPTLLIWGDADRIHPVRQSGLLRTLIPGARYLRLPCGHSPQTERPDEVSAALREHLGLVPAAGSRTEP